MQEINEWLNLKNTDGDTALSLAAQRYDHKITELLLNSNAIITTSNQDGNTPHHIAVITAVPAVKYC